MTNLLTLNYWFNLRPEALTPMANRLFITFIILLVVLAFASIRAKKKNKLYRGFLQKLYNFSFTNIIIGLIFMFFNYESLPFFSARFWLGLWAIGMIVWLVFILKGLKSIPQKKEELDKEKEFNKYLP